MLRAIAEVVEQRAYEREAEIRDQARPLITQLVSLATELRQVQLDLDKVQDARAPTGVRPSPSQRRRERMRDLTGRDLIDAAGLVQTQVSGVGSVLDLQPLTPRRPAPEPEPRPVVKVGGVRRGEI